MESFALLPHAGVGLCPTLDAAAAADIAVGRENMSLGHDHPIEHMLNDRKNLQRM